MVDFYDADVEDSLPAGPGTPLVVLPPAVNHPFEVHPTSFFTLLLFADLIWISLFSGDFIALVGGPVIVAVGVILLQARADAPRPRRHFVALCLFACATAALVNGLLWSLVTV